MKSLAWSYKNIQLESCGGAGRGGGGGARKKDVS